MKLKVLLVVLVLGAVALFVAKQWEQKNAATTTNSEAAVDANKSSDDPAQASNAVKVQEEEGEQNLEASEETADAAQAGQLAKDTLPTQELNLPQDASSNAQDQTTPSNATTAAAPASANAPVAQ